MSNGRVRRVQISERDRLAFEVERFHSALHEAKTDLEVVLAADELGRINGVVPEFRAKMQRSVEQARAVLNPDEDHG